MAHSFQAFALKPGAAEAAAAAAKEEQFRQDLAVRLTCPNCPPDRPSNVQESYSDGDLVCGNCGLVLGDRVIDTRSEWRTFANEDGDDPSRVGGPTNSLIDGPDDFQTQISFRDNNTGISKNLQRASRTVNAKSSNSSMAAAFEAIQAMAEVLGSNRNVVDTARQLYKRAEEEKVFRGPRSVQAHAAACLFIASRQMHVARTFKEVIQLTGVPDKPFITAFKLLKQRFEGTGPAALSAGGPKPSGAAPTQLSSDQIAASAEAIVIRFCSNLALPANIQTAACEVTKNVTNLGTLTGRSPITVATSCIYFTAALLGKPKTAAEIAAVGGIAEGTVRFAYKLILPKAKEIINLKWIDNGRADLSRLPK